jgi:outer membrane protein OmpA-like peptidoglycan-associated protein
MATHSGARAAVGMICWTLVVVVHAASTDEARLQPALAHAADYSAVYPTNVFPAGTREIVAVFRLAPGESFKRFNGRLVAVDVGSAAAPNLSVAEASADARLELGSFRFDLPRPFPAGRYRVDVTGDGRPWKSAEFTVAAAGSAPAPPLPVEQLVPLAAGHSWSYAFLLESGPGVHVTLDNAKQGADGKFRGTDVERVLGHDAAGVHIEMRLGPQPLEEWWRVGQMGLVVTQRKIRGEMFVVDPPQLVLPWPPKTPQSWEWRAKDPTIEIHQTYHMWGPVPVLGPNGPAPGFVVLVEEQEPNGPTTTFERHYLPGFGKVREVLVQAAQGALLFRQELTLKNTPDVAKPNADDAGRSAQPPAAGALVSAAKETDIAGVTAGIAFLRQYDGVLHLGIVLHNGGDKEVAAQKPLEYGELVIIDRKANKKYFVLKDANGQFLAGPAESQLAGGRWDVRLAPHSDTLMWALFQALPDATVVGVEGPIFHAFDNVPIAQTPPAPGQELASSLPPLQASVVSADRADGQLKVRLKITSPGSQHPANRTVNYARAYALDPQGKRSYPLLKDTQGLYLASPQDSKVDGGRWSVYHVPANGQQLVDLTFQAPPDAVRSVDIVFPWFPPFEAVAISGEGGAAASGVAVAGQSADLERVLKDLNAENTPQEIRINLSADLLFAFDKADIEAAAEPQLDELVTVLKSYPNAHVTIDGHADGKGDAAYNQKLSERRAAAVAQWLISHGAITGARIETRGLGKTKPIAPNTNADGSDNPQGRAKNRRVEITVTKS